MGGFGTIYHTTQSGLQEQAREMARLQEIVSSGVRVRRASDTPVDAFRILGMRSEGETLDGYLKNLGGVSDSLTIATGVLEQMSDILGRVRELLAQAASGTYSVENRAPIAGEVDSLLSQLVLLANTRHQGQYLFGGSRSDVAPYEIQQEDGRISRVTYVGGEREVAVPVGRGVTYSGVLVGEDFFREDDREGPAFLGATGAAPGAGTATVRGDAWLTVTHTGTTYLGASGVAPGDSYLDGDTILGNGHTLTIDAPAGTLQLDGGPVVSFAGGETDLRLENESGDAVYVDVTALDPLFVGTVGIQAAGELSLDDGATGVPIDFSDTNLAVTDSATGRRLYVNATGIGRTGLEPVRVPGTYDVFNALITVRDVMRNQRDLSEQEQMDLLNESVAVVDGIQHLVSRATAASGARIGALETLEESLENQKAYAEDEAAELENADIVAVSTDLVRRETLYQAVLMSASRLLRLTLINYL